ncbi:MAG: urease accessory protein UreD [Thermomicrobiales bacterium]
MTNRRSLSGTLRLDAAQWAERTALIEVSQSAPFHIGTGSERLADRGCDVIVQSVGPGQLPGDRLTIDLRASEGSTLVVRGQSAICFFSSPDDQAAIACTTLRAHGDSTLISISGELIPYRNAVLD